MKYKKLKYVVYSESEDKSETDNIIEFGKWKLIWFFITNRFNKGVYGNRIKLEIIIEKLL